jgi:hypothetical protein
MMMMMMMIYALQCAAWTRQHAFQDMPGVPQ